MLDYLSTFVNTNGVGFPLTGAVDSSGGAATDGTEFIAAMINDSLWGPWQAILDYTGQTPNGITEAPGASQILEALRRIDIPGKIIGAFWNDDPATLGIRALQLTGQGILRANYPELDALVYVGDGDNATAAAFYRADNANGTGRNIAGVYLILPDARGRVTRFLDLTGSVDPDGAGRELGDFQGSAMWGHWHNAYGTNAAALAVVGFTVSSNGSNNTTLAAGAAIKEAITDGVNPAPVTDSESRMINLAANGFITF